MNKYLLWALGIIVIMILGVYFWKGYSGKWTGNCADLPASDRDFCCANQPRDVVVITCEGGWAFDNDLKLCNYVCSTSSGDTSTNNITENTSSTNSTKPSGLFCTSDVKQCPDEVLFRGTLD